MQSQRQSLNEPIILQPGEGERIEFVGNEITIKLTAEQTGGAFSVVEYSVAPSFEAPPVLHANTLEAWAGFVLEGTLGFELGDERRVVAPKGSFLFFPRNALFKWWNETDQPARWLCIYSPAGFENYFKEVSAVIEEFPKENFNIKDAMPRVLPLWEKYGIK